jgi:hypothetical protein
MRNITIKSIENIKCLHCCCTLKELSLLQLNYIQLKEYKCPNCKIILRCSKFTKGSRPNTRIVSEYIMPPVLIRSTLQPHEIYKNKQYRN